MITHFCGGNICGEISAPPSESRTQHAIFLASLCNGRSFIFNPLISECIKSTIAVCESFGAYIKPERNLVRVENTFPFTPDCTVDSGSSETALISATGVAAQFDKEIKLTGDESLKTIPMTDFLDTLKNAGVECSSYNGCIPITVKGPVKKDFMSVGDEKDSRPVSALMIASPIRRMKTEINIIEKRVSDSHIDMTADMMKIAGAEVVRIEDSVYIGDRGYVPFNYSVPMDYSLAAFSMIAATLNGKNVKLINAIDDVFQDDKIIIDIIKKSGAKVNISGNEITISKSDKIIPLNIDMGSSPNLIPAVAVLLSVADGESTIYGVPHLKCKDSILIQSTVEMINTLGGEAVATEDGCKITGKPILEGGDVKTYGNPKIMMSAAIASVICKKTVDVDDADCFRTSYPEFLQDMVKIGLKTW